MPSKKISISLPGSRSEKLETPLETPKEVMPVYFGVPALVPPKVHRDAAQ
jgi:hypothetical protein